MSAGKSYSKHKIDSSIKRRRTRYQFSDRYNVNKGGLGDAKKLACNERRAESKRLIGEFVIHSVDAGKVCKNRNTT